MPKNRELRPLEKNVKQNVEMPELKPMRKVERSQKALTLKELSIKFDDSWKLAIKEIQSLGKLIKRFATEMYKQNAELEKELKKKATKEELAVIWEAIEKRTDDISKQIKSVRKESRPIRKDEAPSEILDLIEKENKKLEEQLIKHEKVLKDTLENSIKLLKTKDVEKPKAKEKLLGDFEKQLTEFNEKALGRFIETKAILNDIELNILTKQKEFKEMVEELKQKKENKSIKIEDKINKDMEEEK